MIIGTGIDIIELARIAEMIGKFGDKFAQRICTPLELDRMPANDQIPFIGKRWATKEAVVKAMGTGFRDNISFQDMWTTHDKFGCPTLHLSPKIIKLMEPKIPNTYHLRAHVSASDTTNDATAMVILEIISNSDNIPPIT